MRLLPDDWQFANVPPLADSIGVCQAKLLTWINTGALKAINVATSTATKPRYRIRRSDWEAFLATRETAPAPSVPKVRTRRPANIKSYV